MTVGGGGACAASVHVLPPQPPSHMWAHMLGVWRDTWDTHTHRHSHTSTSQSAAPLSSCSAATRLARPRPPQLEASKFTRKNENVRPFEPGGEASLEFYCNKNNCPLFVLGSHSKKRPHNLVLGRMYDFHLYDALELGVEDFKGIRDFGAAGTAAQMGNKVKRCNCA